MSGGRGEPLSTATDPLLSVSVLLGLVVPSLSMHRDRMVSGSSTARLLESRVPTVVGSLSIRFAASSIYRLTNSLQ